MTLVSARAVRRRGSDLTHALVGLLVACAAPAPPPIASAPRPTTISTVTEAASAKNAFPPVGPFRLPHTFEPTSYRVRLAIEEDGLTGHVEIEGDLADAGSLIWLHGVDLVVSHATALHDGTTIALDASPPRPDQLLGLQSRDPLPRGHLTLSIDYRGRVYPEEPPSVPADPRLRPSYPPSFGVFRRTVDGKAYFFTQSESIYARRIFPCIDDPDRKVPWQLTLDVGADLTAVSNSAVVRETSLDAAHKRVEFAPTLPLPSYLIAFAAGPFEVLDAGEAKSGVPIHILEAPGRAAKVNQSRTALAGMLDALETLLSVPYPYAKLDIVAVPHFDMAMENPGLITIGDRLIESSIGQGILGHELAHQWFGDLVTMSWWDDLWLNESFADWIASRILHPSERAAQRQEGLARIDELRNFEVRAHAQDLQSIEFQAFNDYRRIGKGVAVLDVLEAYLGPQRFTAALHAYLKKHAHRNVTTSDLIAALDEASGRSLDGVVTTLLDDVAPTLPLELHCDTSPRVVLNTYPSTLPICVAYDRDGKRADACGTIDSHNSTVALPAKRCPRWILPDGDLGPYRVEWSPRLLEAIVADGWKSLSPDERAAVFRELDGDAKLRLVTTAPETLSATDLADFLAGITPNVPADLRLSFDSWVVRHVGTRAKAVSFALRADELHLLEPIEKADADAAFAEHVFALAVTDQHLPGPDGSEFNPIWVLAHTHRLRELVTSHRDELAELGPGLPHLFTYTSDPVVRAKLSDLAQSHPQEPEFAAAVARLDENIAKANKLAPKLRRWLVPGAR
jgi:alanyl aminopeptidase